MGVAHTSAPVDALLSKLQKVKGRNGQWQACCPVHEDERSVPSLSISIGNDGRALLHCQRDCATEEIVAAVGMTMADLYPESRQSRGALPTLRVVRSSKAPTARPREVACWTYTDESGVPLYDAVRLEFPLEPGDTKPKKTFRQRRPDPSAPGGYHWNLDGTRLVPYRLPELIGALEDGKQVFITEGEKHADALNALGLPATTTPMGAGKWREEYAEHFAGADVVILPDNDDVGRAHAEQVAASLTARGCTVRVLALPGLPEKGDIIDWLALARADDIGTELSALVTATPAWSRETLDARVTARRQTRFTLRELFQNEEVMRPPVAIVPRIAWGGRLTLLAGLYKLGKSTLTGFLAAAVTNGTRFLDAEPCLRGDVLLFGLEEWIGDPARRLQMFGADLDRMHIVDRLLSTPQERLIELKEHVDAVRPALVIVDSLIKFGSGIIQSENDAAQMQAVVDPLAELAHDYGEMGTILIAHARKSDGKARGSGAIMGAVDVVCEFMQPEATAFTRPMLRRMQTSGRVPVPPSYDFLYDGRHYALEGEGQQLGDAPVASLESRIITWVRNNPGCSARSVRENVEGREKETLSAITHLLANHALQDVGRGNAHRLYVPTDSEIDLPFGTVDQRSAADAGDVHATTGDQRTGAAPLGHHLGTTSGTTS